MLLLLFSKLSKLHAPSFQLLPAPPQIETQNLVPYFLSIHTVNCFARRLIGNRLSSSYLVIKKIQTWSGMSELYSYEYEYLYEYVYSYSCRYYSYSQL